MSIDPNLIPEVITVTDSQGIPDHIINTTEIHDDGFTLALEVGAAAGDQDRITAAVATVVDKWQGHAGYVLANGLTQLARDLVPAVAELTKAATGVDWHAHCEAMLEAHREGKTEYDPNTVDTERKN